MLNLSPSTFGLIRALLRADRDEQSRLVMHGRFRIRNEFRKHQFSTRPVGLVDFTAPGGEDPHMTALLFAEALNETGAAVQDIYPILETVEGIAKRYSVPATTVREWLRAEDFPQPIDPTVKRGWVWDFTQVMIWVDANRRKYRHVYLPVPVTVTHEAIRTLRGKMEPLLVHENGYGDPIPRTSTMDEAHGRLQMRSYDTWPR